MNVHRRLKASGVLLAGLLLLWVVVFPACSGRQTTEPTNEVTALDDGAVGLARMGMTPVAHWGTARLKPVGSDADAAGAAKLAILDDNTMSVIIRVRDMDPGAYENNVYWGKCNAVGDVAYGLKGLGVKADGTGGQDTWFHLSDMQVDALVNGNEVVVIWNGSEKVLCGTVRWR
ncbi:MAG: hypothetical protein ACE5HO_11160 [bacterium]